MKNLLLASIVVLSLVGCTTTGTTYTPTQKQLSEPPIAIDDEWLDEMTRKNLNI